MNLEQRIDLLVKLGNYCKSDEPGWISAQRRAHAENGWFTPEFIGLSIRQIADEFLQKEKLTQWVRQYRLSAENPSPKTIGLTMAGNIPLVGFHDFLSIFITGHRGRIKPSSKDNVLIRHLIEQLEAYDPRVRDFVSIEDRLTGCDAYIATGSNNSSRYFDYYFGKYPHIIRRNRTSVAVLTGLETREELNRLADDVYQYFGLGCRNVTKLYVPENYDFLSLLEAFRRYNYLADLSKYKHNYDYQLTILLLNKKYYMTNGTILLAENPAIFTPISVLNYEYYQLAGPDDPVPGAPSRPVLDGSGVLSQEPLVQALTANPDVQCIVGQGGIPFGNAQHPALNDYADGVDTLQFLRDL